MEKFYGCPGVEVHAKKAVIIIDHIRFVFGYNNNVPSDNSEGSTYISAEVHAGLNGKNIANMSIYTASCYLLSAIKTLEEQYGISILYEWDALKVTRMEINVTFPINQPYHAYARIMQMVKLEVMGKKPAYSVEKQTIKGAIDRGDVFCDRATITTRVYCKRDEVQQKEHGVHFDRTLMRVEFNLKKEPLIKSDFDTAFLAQITDDMIMAVFRKRINAVQPGIDKRLSWKTKAIVRETGVDVTIHSRFIT